MQTNSEEENKVSPKSCEIEEISFEFEECQGNKTVGQDMVKQLVQSAVEVCDHCWVLHTPAGALDF